MVMMGGGRALEGTEWDGTGQDREHGEEKAVPIPHQVQCGMYLLDLTLGIEVPTYMHMYK